MIRPWTAAGLAILATLPARAADVSGRVAMSELCAPAVSRAVVTLRPIGTSTPAAPATDPGTAVRVDQRGLRFDPRVVAVRVGQTVEFTNLDDERHVVHVVSGGDFNRAMAPGELARLATSRPGVLKLACDIHGHMRGYVVVADTPWVRTCDRDGNYRFADVPEGRYTLKAWHEVGDPVEREVVVGPGPVTTLPELALDGPVVATGPATQAPVRSWPEVIDRISTLLASSLDAAGRPGRAKEARRLAEDAYFVEFETSDMELAVRNALGIERAGAIEGRFRKLWTLAAGVAKGQAPARSMADESRRLLVDLSKASDDLGRLSITDRTNIFARSAPTATGAAPPLDRSIRRAEFGRALQGVRDLADRGEPDEAASAMAALYFESFEPIEAAIASQAPQDVRPLEIEFNAIRGEVGSGSKGGALAARLDGFQVDVDAALERVEGRASGSFAPAFAASLLTIVREGVEVILLIAMLLALVAKAGRPDALRSIRWGIGLAAVASVVTAVGLNMLVASAQGRTRELVEGGVMLAASGVLFYVSYWLISQTEARRWADFLKEQARRGAELGGYGTLGLTAFLAVYREGAETALMGQALISGQGGSRPGYLGLAAGLGVGLVLLAAIALAIRRATVRLPLRAFFKLTGLALFAMAVVFAGNGVFELQSSGLIRVTPIAWLGAGSPVLGVHPNAQALAVQALLLGGAILAWVVMKFDRPAADPVAKAIEPSAGVAAH